MSNPQDEVYKILQDYPWRDVQSVPTKTLWRIIEEYIDEMEHDQHKITPHKGGRSERLYIRIKPEVKRKAEELAARQGVTVADIIEQLIEAAE